MTACFLALLFPAVTAADSAAAEPGCPAPPTHTAATAMARADSLFEAGLTRGALACLEGILVDAPGDYEALWRAASLAVALGVELEEGSRAGAAEWYRRAEAWAVAAQRANPRGIEGRYWQMAVLGRQALGSGPREASDLSDRILALGSSILGDAPDHAPTHNALGRLHLEIMSRSGVSRFFGRTLLGGPALREASWDRALRGLRRAVELEPERSMFHLDLGRYHLARGERTAAREALQAAIRTAGTHPPDRVFAEEARALLREAGS
jgi:regulator of microtubule dynamics protein 3